MYCMNASMQSAFSIEDAASILGLAYRTVASWRLQLPNHEPTPGGRGVTLSAVDLRALALWRDLRRAGVSGQRAYQLRSDVIRLAANAPEAGYVAVPVGSRAHGQPRLRWYEEPCEALAAITRGEASTVFEWRDPLAGVTA